MASQIEYVENILEYNSKQKYYKKVSVFEAPWFLAL